jgi:hypothetical protein
MKWLPWILITRWQAKTFIFREKYLECVKLLTKKWQVFFQVDTEDVVVAAAAVDAVATVADAAPDAKMTHATVVNRTVDAVAAVKPYFVY